MLGAIIDGYRARRAWGVYKCCREQLRQSYFAAGSSSGSPRGVTWGRCEWTGETRLLRERSDRSWWLLSGVQLSFEAIPGGDMEDVAAVTSLRTATAVFHLADGQWLPTGRTLFNFDPASAAELFRESHEVYRVECNDKKTVPEQVGDGPFNQRATS